MSLHHRLCLSAVRANVSSVNTELLNCHSDKSCYQTMILVIGPKHGASGLLRLLGMSKLASGRTYLEKKERPIQAVKMVLANKDNIKSKSPECRDACKCPARLLRIN